MNYLKTFDFDNLSVSTEAVEALASIQEFNRETERHLSMTMQLPEPGFLLDLESQESDGARQFAHIHQMCTLHATHFEIAHKIKSAYLLDSYLWGASCLNPIAVYNAARSILELHAFVRYVEHILSDAASGGSENWRDRGQRYFSVILRARYGTTDRSIRARLQESGVDPDVTQLVQIKKAREFLQREIPWVNSHYVRLSDFVHHNLMSQRTAGAYAGEKDVAVSSRGGGIITPGGAPTIQYSFPMPVSGRRAVEETAVRAWVNIQGMVSALNRMPRTPYSEDEIERWTGSKIDFTKFEDQE